MSYDVLLCVSHRCLTIVMKKMFCQRWTWCVGNSCYIPAVMGHPKDASGCHCVLLLCHLMYCHLPNISPWRLRRFTKSQSHLIATYPATALCTWRIKSHQTTCHRVTPRQWEKLQSVEWSPWVSSFSKLYSELVQWQPLSLLVFVKITKTTNWSDMIRPLKAAKRKNPNRTVCLMKPCMRLFYTNKARSPLRSCASQQGQLHDFMCLISFKLSTLWLSPAGGSSPAKVANTIEFHPEIRGKAFPPRPSCRVRPVSGGRGRRYPSPRGRRPRRAAPRPPPGGRLQPHTPAARCLGPEGAAGDGDGTCQFTWVASEDLGGFRIWKIGSLVMFGPPFLTETCITAYRNQDQLISWNFCLPPPVAPPRIARWHQKLIAG